MIIDSNSEWFRIVGGIHTHSALMYLVEEHPDSWSTFLWPVLVLQRTPPIDTLNKIARLRNELSTEHYRVQTTLFDLLNGLAHEKHKLIAIQDVGKTASVSAIACSYDGVKKGKIRRARRTLQPLL